MCHEVTLLIIVYSLLQSEHWNKCLPSTESKISALCRSRATLTAWQRYMPASAAVASLICNTPWPRFAYLKTQNIILKRWLHLNFFALLYNTTITLEFQDSFYNARKLCVKMIFTFCLSSYNTIICYCSNKIMCHKYLLIIKFICLK